MEKQGKAFLVSAYLVWVYYFLIPSHFSPIKTGGIVQCCV